MTVHFTYFLGTFRCKFGFLDMLHEVFNPIEIQEMVIKGLGQREQIRNVPECIQSGPYIWNMVQWCLFNPATLVPSPSGWINPLAGLSNQSYTRAYSVEHFNVSKQFNDDKYEDDDDNDDDGHDDDDDDDDDGGGGDGNDYGVDNDNE